MITSTVRIILSVILFTSVLAHLSYADERTEYFFRSAAGSGNIDDVREYLNDGVDVNAGSSRGYTALLLSAMRGHMEVVGFLIENGADINVKDNDGDSPLIAAVSNGHKKVVETLLEKGADINIRDRRGRTPLIKATESDAVEIVRILLQKGADVTPASYGNETALSIARERGYSEIEGLLLEKGAGTVVAEEQPAEEESAYSTPTLEEPAQPSFDWTKRSFNETPGSGKETLRDDENGDSATFFKVSSAVILVGGILLIML